MSRTAVWDVVVESVIAALSGIVVAVFTYLLASARWEREFGARLEELELRRQEVEAQFGAGARIQALTELYGGLGVLTRADRWPAIKLALEEKLDSAQGHFVPREVRDQILRILTETDEQAEKLDPNWPEIEDYRKQEEEELAIDLASASPEVQADAEIARLRFAAMGRIKELVSTALLDYVERAHPRKIEPNRSGPAGALQPASGRTKKWKRPPRRAA